MSIIDKLIAIANGFRSSRGIAETLSLDEMATLAAEPMKLPQVVDRTITEITAQDLAGATKIGSYAFADYDSLTSIIIPDSVTSIGICAFAYCESLTSVTIGNGVTSIDYNAFYECRCLKSITIPNSVISLGSFAFYSCSSLTSVTIPNSITKIESYTFYWCSSLTSIIIPNSVTSINSSALHIGSSTNKATITFLGTTPPSITTDTFEISQLEKIIVPAGCGETYKNATNWANFADYIEEATA